MKKKAPIVPAVVSDWIHAHRGRAHAIHSPGSFAEYAASNNAACWGTPPGGHEVGDGYRVALCQPSGGNTIYFDFIKEGLSDPMNRQAKAKNDATGWAVVHVENGTQRRRVLVPNCTQREAERLAADQKPIPNLPSGRVVACPM